MFGLTKREQYWKAQQVALDSFLNARVVIEKFIATNDEIARLREELRLLKEQQAIATAMKERP